MESDLDRWERTNNILAEVMEEREKQFEKWGDQLLQFHDPQDRSGIYLLGRPYAVLESMAKQRCDAYRSYSAMPGRRDVRNNALVLLEEVFEALAAKTPSDRRAELIQVAAVAVKAIEALDRADGIPPAGPPLTDDVARLTDVFLPGDGSVMVDGERVTGRMEVPPVPDKITPKRDLPDGAWVPEYSDADRAAVNVHTHTFDRLHGLCRCGEAKGEGS